MLCIGLGTPGIWRHSLSNARWHWIPRSVGEQGLKSPDSGSTRSVTSRQSDLGQDSQPICEVGANHSTTSLCHVEDGTVDGKH